MRRRGRIHVDQVDDVIWVRTAMSQDDTDGEDAAIADAMAADTSEAETSSRRLCGGRRRPRLAGGRPHQVMVRFTDEEYKTLALRATASHLGLSHYLALRALEPPGQRVAMDVPTLQTWAVEVRGLQRQVQRVGVNVNQVARLLNGGGGVGRRADEALAATEVMVARLDPLVEWLMRVAGFVE